MAIKATAFRANLYRLLEKVLEEGTPLDVELNGRQVEIRPKILPGGKFAKLVKRPEVWSKEESDLLVPVFDMAAWEAKWDARLGSTLRRETPPRRRRKVSRGKTR